MPKITRRIRIGKNLTFSSDERVFSKLENKISIITSRNIKDISFNRWMVTVMFVSRLSIFDSTRTSRVKPELFSFGIRKSVKTRFTGGKMVFHILEIRSKATNVAEISRKNIRGSIKTPKVFSRGAI